MKKAISSILTGVILLLALSACDSSQDLDLPEDFHGDKFDRFLYIDFYYSSIEDLYRTLQNIPVEDIDILRTKEASHLRDIKTHISQDELRYGIIGNFVKTFVESGTVMFPYYQDESLPLRKSSDCISFNESGSFWRPWIDYGGNIDGEHFGVGVTHYDLALIGEANEKGASWLISKLDPDEVFEPYLGSEPYAKEVRLGDRGVLAVVAETNDYGGYPLIKMFFVYDNILVSISGNPKTVEATLPHLTFREIHMPTGEPLRDTPGRAWD